MSERAIPHAYVGSIMAAASVMSPADTPTADAGAPSNRRAAQRAQPVLAVSSFLQASICGRRMAPKRMSSPTSMPTIVCSSRASGNACVVTGKMAWFSSHVSCVQRASTAPASSAVRLWVSASDNVPPSLLVALHALRVIVVRLAPPARLELSGEFAVSAHLPASL